MDDFYIYYEPDPQSPTIGIIRAVAPIELDEMNDMEFIRVSSEIGLSFTKGSESLNQWIVRWTPEFGEMCLHKQEQNKPKIVADFLEIIPTRQTKAQVIVTWKRESNMFNVRTRGISISHPNIDMFFFVTRQGDPNIIYDYFGVALRDTMNRKGLDISRDIILPKKFSVCTRTAFDRYQLRIER